MRPLAIAFAVLLLAGCQAPQSDSAPPTEHGSTVEELFAASAAPQPDLICFPWMNMMHISGCPMVLV